MPGPAALSINNLSKSFHGHEVLRALSLEVRPGSMAVLIGRSGCGKSTLLRCINGLEHPDSGEVRLGDLSLRYPHSGKNHPLLHDLRQHIGMVFQHFNLFPHWTAEENVALPPRIVLGAGAEAAITRASELLAMVGLSSHRSHYPSQLSGGQQQRLSIARALAMRQQVLLYDEPTASLDPHLTGEVLEVMLKLKKQGLTQVLVTHEHAFAAKAADLVAFIEDGAVVEAGTPAKIFKRARDPRTRRFVAGLK